MDGLIGQAIRLFRQEGMLALMRRTNNYLIRKLQEYILPLKGNYTLSIGNVQSSFSAPNRTVVRRNMQRFQSEREQLEAIMQELQSTDVFYDIGANNGLYSIFAAHFCDQVVAFEPYPPNVSQFKKDVSRNSLDNVTLLALALSNQDGTIAFSQPSTADVGYGSSSIQAEKTSNTIKVKTRRGDTLVSENDIAPPNVVKIDVEGAEPLVVEGMTELLASPQCRLLYCEVHRDDSIERPSVADFGSSLEQIKTKFKGFGFNVKIIKERDGEVFVRATKNDERAS